MSNSRTNKIQHKVYGAVLSDKCDACGKTSSWLLAKQWEKLSFFGAPLMDWHTEFTLICASCGYGIAIYKDLFDKLKPLAEKNPVRV